MHALLSLCDEVHSTRNLAQKTSRYGRSFAFWYKKSSEPCIALATQGKYNIRMYYVYILKNKITGELYNGFSEDLKTRLKSHKEKTVKTTKKGAYELIWYSAFLEKQKALDFEKYIKQGSGFAFTRKHLI